MDLPEDMHPKLKAQAALIEEAFNEIFRSWELEVSAVYYTKRRMDIDGELKMAKERIDRLTQDLRRITDVPRERA